MKIPRGKLCQALPYLFASLTCANAELTSSRIVTQVADSGPGSLREMLALAATTPGAETITFSPALNGQIITLASEILINDPDGVTVDASSLPKGITITDMGDVNHRLMSVTGGTAGLRALTLANGGGNLFAASSRGGGAILNQATLLLDQCTLSGNTAQFGGAVSSVTNSDFTSTKTLLNRCTLSGNTATSRGGSIHNTSGRTTIIHCTISGNSAPTGSGSGIASTGDAFTETVVKYSIIVENSNSNVDFVEGGANSFISQGYNLIGLGNATGDFNQPGDQINPSSINLAPLGNYGGPSPTVALKPLSRARNSAFGSTITSDQRGFPVVGTPDIGAYEAGTLANFNAWISEILPATATTQQSAPSFDFDGDGQSNALEYATLGNPTVPGTARNMTLTRNPAGTHASLEMPYRYSAPDLSYTIERSSNLGTWTPIAQVDSATNLIYPTTGVSLSANSSISITLNDTFIPGQPKLFYRVNAAVKAP